MNTVFYPENPVDGELKSLFLAGPTERGNAGSKITAWRKSAISYLQVSGFAGNVFVPEFRPGANMRGMCPGSADQRDWEGDFLEAADCIVFWVPRNLGNMPGFTTNIEWGMWCDSGKAVLGYPPYAPKMSHMRHYADQLGVPVAHTLGETLDCAMLVISGL